MEKTVYLMLVDGFEEVEALTPVDILRRAGITVKTVSVTGRAMVKGSHDIWVRADIADEGFTLPEDAAMLVLPGGPGTTALLESDMVEKAVGEAARANLLIGAICAAPRVLHKYGLLEGRRATAFPSVQPELVGAKISGAATERDGNIITGRAAGVSLQFAYRLVEALLGVESAEKIVRNVYPESFAL